jgi:hypothetical protein
MSPALGGPDTITVGGGAGAPVAASAPMHAATAEAIAPTRAPAETNRAQRAARPGADTRR